jgi:hypothetical protein
MISRFFSAAALVALIAQQTHTTTAAQASTFASYGVFGQ